MVLLKIDPIGGCQLRAIFHHLGLATSPEILLPGGSLYLRKAQVEQLGCMAPLEQVFANIPGVL